MSQEWIAIIGAAIGLAAMLVPTMRGLRKDIESVRKDIAAMGENTRKDIAALGERVGKVELGVCAAEGPELGG